MGKLFDYILVSLRCVLFFFAFFVCFDLSLRTASVRIETTGPRMRSKTRAFFFSIFPAFVTFYKQSSWKTGSVQLVVSGSRQFKKRISVLIITYVLINMFKKKNCKISIISLRSWRMKKYWGHRGKLRSRPLIYARFRDWNFLNISNFLWTF